MTEKSTQGSRAVDLTAQAPCGKRQNVSHVIFRPRRTLVFFGQLVEITEASLGTHH